MGRGENDDGEHQREELLQDNGARLEVELPQLNPESLEAGNKIPLGDVGVGQLALSKGYWKATRVIWRKAKLNILEIKGCH